MNLQPKRHLRLVRSRLRDIGSSSHLLRVRRETWYRLLRLAGLQGIAPQADATMVDWWLRSRKHVPKPARKEFDSVVLLTSWKERNRRTFDRIFRTPQELLRLIVDEAHSWVGAGFTSLSSVIGPTLR